MITRALPPDKTKPYIERVQHRPKPRIPKHGDVHRPLEFAFDPSDFICDPLEVIAHVCDHGFYKCTSR